MHWIYLIARIYPFVAFPVAVILFQLAMYKRRTSGKKGLAQWAYFSASGLTALSALAWLIFRGDLHSDLWIAEWLGETLSKQ